MTCMQVLSLVNNSHYLYRMTILSAVAALAPAVSHDVLCNNMLPVVISCSKDKARHLPLDLACPNSLVSFSKQRGNLLLVYPFPIQG